MASHDQLGCIGGNALRPAVADNRGTQWRRVRDLRARTEGGCVPAEPEIALGYCSFDAFSPGIGSCVAWK
jgi:hypothetical protein